MMCYLKCSGAVSMFHFVHSLICVDTATMKLQRHFMNRLAKHIAKTLLLYLVMYFNVDLFCIDLQNRVQYTTKTVSLNHTSLFIHPKIHPLPIPTSHPHGDTAVYDALVRLAQPFSTNHPLIDGHGNFGSIDADPAAAMRYTECKLTKLAAETLLEDIKSDTVDYLPNFDGSEYEPAVLPAKVPVLLLNGGAGIAVGMATNVPPHNLGELLEACVEMVRGRNEGREVEERKLLSIVPGPDFPVSL